MKDRNGKTLKKGDVFVSHVEDERYFGKIGVVEQHPEAFYDEQHFCIRSKKTGEIVMKDLPSNLYVEIIGDVR